MCMWQAIRVALFLTAAGAALVLFPVAAHAGSGFRRAIDSGVAGAVAGKCASGCNAAKLFSPTLSGAAAKLRG
jgi:hypothetical protein